MEEGRVVNEYTQDGTVDLKGKPILKSKSGGWNACSFVVVYEIFERMAYYGISSNLILYLTRKLHQGTVTSSNNVTNWVGTIWITPILGAYVADAHLGRYWTFVIASVIYLMGMSLLTLSVSLPSLKPPECHELDVTKCEKASILHLAVLLNKACVNTDSTTSGWMLSPVTHVEETKQMLRMIPILAATLIPSAMVAQIGTLFVKQGITLDRGIGSFNIPPASLATFVTLSMLVCVVLYDRFFVKIMQRFTKNPRGITLLQRIGIGLIIHIVIMVVASLTERYRLRVAKEHGLVENGGQVPLSIFILLPQYVLMGAADAFVEVAKIEFFYDQAPESMKSLGTSYSMTTLGIGNFLSTFLLTTISHVTKKHGHRGWVLNNLNASHLDYYYALLAILNFLNFIFFMVVTKFYVYRAEISDSIKVLEEELKEKTSNQVIPRD
ncbi:hypothetical protein JHK86_002804 [Glycine max]|nr:hypothetical protein JHK86_002804 [Glycine max]